MKQKIYFHLNLNCSYNDMEKRSAVNQGKGFIRPWVTDDLFKVVLLSAKKKTAYNDFVHQADKRLPVVILNAHRPI